MNAALSHCSQKAEKLYQNHFTNNASIEGRNRQDDSGRQEFTSASLHLSLEKSLPRDPWQADTVSACLDNEEPDISSASTPSLLWSPVGSLQSSGKDSDISSSSLWSPVGSLSSGRDSDTSSQQTGGTRKQVYKAKAERLIKRVVKMLDACDLLVRVEASCGLQDCSILVQVKGDEGMIDQASALIKQALLDVTSESKCLYILGYCSQNAFPAHSRGFETTLAAMENAGRACWHVFKKGFCRHDVDCSKQHPVYKMPLKVFIEASKPRALASIAGEPISDFNLLLAGLVHTLTLSLEQSPDIESVRARKDDSGSWTIQLNSPCVYQHDTDLLTMAQNRLLARIGSSNVVQIVEHAGQSFVPKPNGFVALLSEKSRCLENATSVVPICVVVKAQPIELN